MKDVTVFMLSMVLAAGIVYPGRSVDAGTGAKMERPVAVSTGTVLMDDCRITGQLVRRDDGIHAEIEVVSDKDGTAEFDLHYAGYCLPATSPLSRVMIMPQEVKKGSVHVKLACGETHTESILIQERTQPEGETATVAGTQSNALQVAAMPMTPETWTLSVSRKEIPKGSGGWGASVPAVATGSVVLSEGIAVLARTTQETSG